MTYRSNFVKALAIKEANKKRILELCPDLLDESGLYFLTRSENGFRYAYVGQSIHILTRLAEHLSGYQHIDLSIKKHGLCSDKNPTGWNIEYCYLPADKLDEAERDNIRYFADKGYQLRNVTSGSQGVGKRGLEGQRPSRGYYDGLEQGKKNAQRFVADLFNKHLNFVPKRDPPTKLQEKAMQKMEDFVNGDT